MPFFSCIKFSEHGSITSSINKFLVCHELHVVYLTYVQTESQGLFLYQLICVKMGSVSDTCFKTYPNCIAVLLPVLNIISDLHMMWQVLPCIIVICRFILFLFMLPCELLFTFFPFLQLLYKDSSLGTNCPI